MGGMRRQAAASMAASVAAACAFATTARGSLFLTTQRPMPLAAGRGAATTSANDLVPVRALGSSDRSQDSASAALVGVAFLGAAACGAAAAQRSRRAVVARRAEEEEAGTGTGTRTVTIGTEKKTNKVEWNRRVRRIEGGRAIFDVTITKPLGLVPQAFGNRPGVGVAKIKPDGNTAKHNEEVIVRGMDAMFVLEGDEVIAVNGVDTEGKDIEVVGDLVKNAEGDSITLKLCRNYQKGPVKTVWYPGGEQVTLKRGAVLRLGAEALNVDVIYGCKDGYCSKCWHACDVTNTVYRICKNVVPVEWDNVCPLILNRADVVLEQLGVPVTKLMQADGILVPAPPGLNGDEIRKNIDKLRQEGTLKPGFLNNGKW